jgi:transglutaminase-like putative cysteine protease
MIARLPKQVFCFRQSVPQKTGGTILFTKVPPHFRKIKLSIAVVFLVLLVSCTSAVDSIAWSHLASQQYSAKVEASHQLPDGDSLPPVATVVLEEVETQVLSMSGENDEPAEPEVPEEEEGLTTAPKEKSEAKVKPVTSTASETKTKAPVTKKTEIPGEEPESTPTPAPDPAPAPEPAPKPEPAPVKYVWGSAKTVHFRTQVVATNTGSETATGVSVAVPMLENNSPYQTTTLTGTSYPVDSKSGRTATFQLGDLEPGESKTITVDYSIRIRPVSISSTNETIEKAKIAYDKYAGSGNCHTLAVGFVEHAKSLGLKARVVTGYKRKKGGDITAGSLSGARHSWAEFHVEDLGWVPVDLTYLYFAKIPHASHVVETYTAKQFLRVGYSGGSISTTWDNMIM